MSEQTTDVVRPLSETNAGPWEHLDGTPCPHYYASLPRPSATDLWWCTEHQQLLRSIAETAQTASTAPKGRTVDQWRVWFDDDPHPCVWTDQTEEFVDRQVRRLGEVGAVFSRKEHRRLTTYVAEATEWVRTDKPPGSPASEATA